MTLEEWFTTLSEADVESYVSSQQEEHLQLDFKTLSSPDLSQASDKKNLAKALSGFANSDGGIIVWGVSARKNSDGVDCATGKQPISNLPMLVSRLNALTGEAVSPLIGGVRHKSLSLGDTGLAATLIPASDIGPHMAKLGEYRYYKRSGDSFYRMEHYDVADMFGRRRRPVLTPTIEVAPRGASRSQTTIEHFNAIALFLVNDGRASARELFARVTVNSPYWFGAAGPEADGRGGLTRLSSDGPRSVALGGDSHLVVHPGMRQGVVAVAFRYDQADPRLPDLKLDLEIAADDLPVQRSSHQVRWEDIFAAVR